MKKISWWTFTAGEGKIKPPPPAGTDNGVECPMADFSSEKVINRNNHHRMYFSNLKDFPLSNIFFGKWQ